MRFTAISSSMPQAQVHLSSIIYHLFINHLCRQAKSSSIIYHLFIYNLCGLPQLVHLCRRQKVHLSSIIYYLCRRHKSIYHLLSIIYLSTIYTAGKKFIYLSIIYHLFDQLSFLPLEPGICLAEVIDRLLDAATATGRKRYEHLSL